MREMKILLFMIQTLQGNPFKNITLYGTTDGLQPSCLNEHLNLLVLLPFHQKMFETLSLQTVELKFCHLSFFFFLFVLFLFNFDYK